jgi:hypothetical protein
LWDVAADEGLPVLVYTALILICEKPFLSTKNFHMENPLFSESALSVRQLQPSLASRLTDGTLFEGRLTSFDVSSRSG